jgi:hypothetical protein
MSTQSLAGGPGYDEQPMQSQLEVMPRPECLHKLAVTRVGRIAVADQDGPVVLPVNVYPHGSDIYFRTIPGSALAAAVGSTASFQVDQIDDFQQTGWSILVQGRLEAVPNDKLPSYPSERPVPWAAGPRTLTLCLRATGLTGRRLVE